MSSDRIKIESLEEEIQEVSNAMELMNDTSENFFKELNRKISEVRSKAAEEHAKLNKK